MAQSIFSLLYETFIPQAPKPVKIQARNVLYSKIADKISKTPKCNHNKWWKFPKDKSCNCKEEFSVESKKMERPIDSIDEFAYNVKRTCSFETLYDQFEDSNVDSNTNEENNNDEIILGMDDDDTVTVFDRFIQKCVDITGSVYTCIVVWIIIIVWIVIGIVQGGPNNWQIIMQDGQSIQTYVWDTFLMRQQLDDTEKFLRVYGRLRSRAALLKKLLGEVKEKKDNGEQLLKAGDDDLNVNELENTRIIKVTWFERISKFMTLVLGSLPSIIIYWIGIFIWIGCGALYSPSGNQPPFTGRTTGSNPAYQKFSNQWQMYINTAVALELLITSVFLENIRLKNNEVARQNFEAFIAFDAKLELELRRLTKYTGDNLPIVVRPVPRKGIKKWISFYAGVVGNGLGLFISFIVFAVWLGIGNIMHWNDNWWLIIGTYTGLVGFIDGFTLREVYFDITNYEEKLFGTIIDESQDLLDFVGIDYNIKQQSEIEVKGVLHRINLKISEKMNYICSTPWSVVFSVVVVIGLVAMGCGMLWSETAQLIANTPTMIIEGFFLLILIQAHDWADNKKTNIIGELAESRRKLFHYLNT